MRNILENGTTCFLGEISVAVHHEDAPRWCTHPRSHVQILLAGHHLHTKLFIPDQTVHVVDGWPSPSVLFSHCILLLLYLFYLLFLYLLLPFSYSTTSGCAQFLSLPWTLRVERTLPPSSHRQHPKLYRYYIHEGTKGKIYMSRVCALAPMGWICTLTPSSASRA